MHWLTNGEKKHYAKMVKPKLKGRQLTSNADYVDRRIFCDNIRNIKNLSFDGQPITDPADLYDRGPSELVNEFVKAIEEYGALDEDDEKN